MHRFRASVAAGIESGPDTAVGVDREAGIIRGASAMQAVEALGHDVLVDGATLALVAELGNAAAGGVKVRFTHPGLCADGLGTHLGRMRDFRVQGDKVVGDIHLGQAAAASPEGDLRAYVLTLAEEDPAAFGMSVVVEGVKMWKCLSGAEVPIDGERPADVIGDLPYLRPTALYAVDVVDEPAANRDGMFGRGAALLAMARGTNLDAQEAFAALDRIGEQLGWPADKAVALLSRYVSARTSTAPIAATRVRELTKVYAAHLDLILDRAATGQTEAAIVAEIEQLQVAALATKSNELLARYAADMATKAADLAALRAEHAAALEALTREHAAALGQLQAKVAAAETLAGIATGAPRDPGGGTAGNDADDAPIFTKAQAAAGRIPQDVLLSGAYRLTP